MQHWRKAKTTAKSENRLRVLLESLYWKCRCMTSPGVNIQSGLMRRRGWCRYEPAGPNRAPICADTAGSRHPDTEPGSWNVPAETITSAGNRWVHSELHTSLESRARPPETHVGAEEGVWPSSCHQCTSLEEKITLSVQPETLGALILYFNRTYSHLVDLLF